MLRTKLLGCRRTEARKIPPNHSADITGRQETPVYMADLVKTMADRRAVVPSSKLEGWSVRRSGIRNRAILYNGQMCKD
jgi:hypothetical protein